MACRIIYLNIVQTPGAVVVPSSEVTSLPRAALQRPILSDVLRFQAGWTVGNFENNRIDFNRGGVKVATVAAAVGQTPAQVCTAVVAALEAADATPVWACDYNVAAANKYRISSDLAFTLLFSTGVNKVSSIHTDLGYTSTDKGSATAQVAEDVSYQSRHWINLQVGANYDPKVGIVRGHNLASLAVVTLQLGSATLVGVGLSDGVTVINSQTIGGAGTDPRISYFTGMSGTFYRLIISDVQNSVGFNELGVWFAGPYVDLAFSPEVVDERVELSEVVYAIAGAQHQVGRPTRKVWSVVFRNISAAKKVELEAFAAAVKIGVAFFFNFDTADTTNTRYVFLSEGLSFKAQITAPVTWDVMMTFQEALG